MSQQHRLFIGGSGGIQPFDMDLVRPTVPAPSPHPTHNRMEPTVWAGRR